MSADYIAKRDGIWKYHLTVGGEIHEVSVKVEKGDEIRLDMNVNGPNTPVVDAQVYHSETGGNEDE